MLTSTLSRVLIFLYYSGHPVFCSAVTIIYITSVCFLFVCFLYSFHLIHNLLVRTGKSLCSIPLFMMNVTQCEGLST